MFDTAVHLEVILAIRMCIYEAEEDILFLCLWYYLIIVGLLSA